MPNFTYRTGLKIAGFLDSSVLSELLEGEGLARKAIGCERDTTAYLYMCITHRMRTAYVLTGIWKAVQIPVFCL